MKKEEIEDIKRKNPFNLKIQKIVPLDSPNAMSGETFCIYTTKGKKYKLRYCEDLKKAKRIAKNIKLIPEAFPKFYGQKGRFLLFEWIEGKEPPKKLPLKFCYELGKMVGKAHASNKKNVKFDIDYLFIEKLKRLKKSRAMKEKEIKLIKKLYNSLRNKVSINAVVEFHDLHNGNFIVSKKGKLFFIDEEGFTESIKGMGLSKPLFEFGWMKSQKQKDAFWKGYKKYQDNSFFEGDYKDFIGLIYAVRVIGLRHIEGREYAKEKKYLLDLIKKLLKGK